MIGDQLSVNGASEEKRQWSVTGDQCSRYRIQDASTNKYYKKTKSNLKKYHEGHEEKNEGDFRSLFYQ